MSHQPYRETDSTSENRRKLDIISHELSKDDSGFQIDKVIKLLYQDGILKKYDFEKVSSLVTTKDKTSELTDTLAERYQSDDGEETYEVLIKALFRTGQEKLARRIEPNWPAEKIPQQVYVSMKILWLLAEPAHCTHTLELLDRVSEVPCNFQPLVLPGVQGSVRKGQFDTTDTEICCVATHLGDCHTVLTATAAAIKEYNPDLVLLSGTCAGDESCTKIGDIVVCKEAFNVDIGAVFGRSGVKFEAKAERPAAKDISALEVHLKKLTEDKQGLWMDRQYYLHIPKVSRRFEVYWLTRLYLELDELKNSKGSKWLNKVGWDVASLKINSNNSRVLETHLPSWKGKRLIDYLTKQTATWEVDRSSPLMAKPSDDLVETVTRECGFEPDFPVPDNFDREPSLIYAPICTNISVRQDAGVVFDEVTRINHKIVACDTNTYGFYQQAALCHNNQRFFAVKGVTSHADGIEEDTLVPHVVRLCGLVLIDTLRYFRNIKGPT